MTRHFRLLLAVGLIAGVPVSLEAGQGGLFGPAVEVGADIAVGVPDIDIDEMRVAVAPRVTLHLTSRNSLVFFGDATATRTEFDFGGVTPPQSEGIWTRTQMYGAEFHRALYQSGGFSVSALTGTGLSRRQLFRPAYILPGPGGPSIVPDTLGTAYSPMATLGLSLKQRLTSRLSVHGDIRAIASNDASELRVQAGVSLPVRPYAALGAMESTAYGSTPLRAGQKVWITGGSGSSTEGSINTIDPDRIELTTNTGRVSFIRTDIRRIAVPDSLRNGVVIGAAAGAGALGGLVSFISVVLCEGDCESAVPFVLLGASYGAAFGAIAGALIDSLIDRPRTVFGSESGLQINLTPTLDRHQAGARVQLNW